MRIIDYLALVLALVVVSVLVSWFAVELAAVIESGCFFESGGCYES